jgi:hypothetical protein
VESACRACRGATVKALVAAVVEAFVNAKLERTDISTALYAAASEPEGAAVAPRVSKRGQRALTATRARLEAGAPAKRVGRLREELLVLCQGYAAKSVRSSCCPLHGNPHFGKGALEVSAEN